MGTTIFAEIAARLLILDVQFAWSTNLIHKFPTTLL